MINKTKINEFEINTKKIVQDSGWETQMLVCTSFEAGIVYF